MAMHNEYSANFPLHKIILKYIFIHVYVSEKIPKRLLTIFVSGETVVIQDNFENGYYFSLSTFCMIWIFNRVEDKRCNQQEEIREHKFFKE